MKMDEHETRAAHWLHQNLVSQRLKSKKFIMELLLLNFIQCSWRLHEVIRFYLLVRIACGSMFIPFSTSNLFNCVRLATGIDWFCYQQTLHAYNNKAHEFGCVCQTLTVPVFVDGKVVCSISARIHDKFYFVLTSFLTLYFCFTFSITNDVHFSAKTIKILHG